MTTKPPEPLTLAPCPIISNDEVMPGTHLVWLEAPLIAAGAKPGQFVMVRCGADAYLPRPLSVHQTDGQKLALLFTVAGKGTKWLSWRKPKDTIKIFGPLGNGHTINPDSKNLLVVAGGIGIAPLCFLTAEALKKKCAVTLLLGAPTAPKLYPPNLLPFGAQLVTATEDGTAGKRGMITDFLPEFIGPADQIFACGPLAMYRTMEQIPALKNKPVQVSLEIVMGCGMGVCYGCTIRTQNGLMQVCQDGPVFDMADIIWDEVKGV